MPQSTETNCLPDTDVCDRTFGKIGDVPAELRVRQNFDDAVIANEIYYIPLNINVPNEAEVSLSPMVTLAANAKMTGTAPQSATIGVLVKQKREIKGETISFVRLHMLQATQLGSQDVQLTELISVPREIQAEKIEKAGDGSTIRSLIWGALGTPALDNQNTGAMPVYEYFLAGAMKDALMPLFNKATSVEEISSLSDIAEADQCQLIRKLVFNQISGHYEFNRPPFDCRFFVPNFGVQ